MSDKKYVGEGAARELTGLVKDNAENIAALAEISEGLAATKADVTELDTAYERTWSIETYEQLRALVRSGRHLKKLRYGDIVVVDTIAGLAGKSSWRFQVRGLDEDTPANPNYTHSLTLKCIDDVDNFPDRFSNEALIVFPNGLSAGTYSIQIPSFGGLYTSIRLLCLKTDEALPQNDYILLDVSNSVIILNTHTGSGQAVTLEALNEVPEGAEIIPLGTADGKSENINIFSRAVMGGGEYSKSELRDWLNSTQTAEEREAQWDNREHGAFEIKPTSFKNGFLYRLDPDFVSILGAVKKTTIEYHLDGTASMIESEEIAFLESYSEITGKNVAKITQSGESVYEGKKYGYYNIFDDDMTDGNGESLLQLLRTTHINDMTPLRLSWSFRSEKARVFPCVCVV